MSHADEERDLDEGDQHHSGYAEEVEPGREWKVLALSQAMGKCPTRKRKHEHQREDRSDEAAYRLSRRSRTRGTPSTPPMRRLQISKRPVISAFDESTSLPPGSTS